MSYEDEWFSYTQTDEFNRPGRSPGAGGAYYEPGNIDNIPLADEPLLSPGQGLEFDLAGPIDDYGYDQLGLTPNGGPNGHHQQPGTSNDMYQSMNIVPSADNFAQHMQPSTSDEYNSFEMPTVISGNMDSNSYQDLGIVDPNSYYANQQPSTSQGNGMLMTDSYDMVGPSTSYAPQMDHMDPSSVGNPSSHSGMNQQQHQSMNSGQQMQQPPPPPKPKPKKKAPPKKKPQPPAETTVGSLLTKANKLSQQENNNENQAVKVEARVTTEDMMIISQLMAEINTLRNKEQNGYDHKEGIATLEAQIAHLFSKGLTQSSSNDSAENTILKQIQSLSGNGAPSTQQQPQQQQQQLPPPPPQPKKPASKKKPIPRPVQQQMQHPPQQQQSPMIAQAQMTPSKIMMEPPSTTMVPSNNQMNQMYNGNGSENYAVYQSMEPGTSQQQYNDFQQPQSHEAMLQHHQNQGHPQVIQAKVVPSMNQRTHNYRQAVIFPSHNKNGPGPSPQPLSHESHHMDQIHDQQYHPHDHQRPQSQQMYVPETPYQTQEGGATLGDVIRQRHGRYQGPQDAPHLRQQLISNVNASTNKQMLQRSQAPTPSPGNFHNNNMHQPPYGESYQPHGSYPASHDMQPHSHSHHGYDSQLEASNDFYDDPISQQQNENSTMLVHPDSQQRQQYEQREMYIVMESPPPEASLILSKEELLEKLTERQDVREEAMKNMLDEQMKCLNDPDVTPFRGKTDIFERLLPYHHFSVGEEPVSDFDSMYEKTITNTVSQADALGRKVRNALLRNEAKRGTEWEENLYLFLDTESERRKLEEDRRLAELDPYTFVQNSDIVQAVKSNRLDIELSIRSAPQMPEHLKGQELEDGALTAVYKEYEFDSYDENRPRSSPFVGELELEDDTGVEPETEDETGIEPELEEQEGEASPEQSPNDQIAQFFPIPSPNRFRDESQSPLDWRDDHESPMLSPETVQFPTTSSRGIEKVDVFPYGQLPETARKDLQPHTSESLGSSDQSSSSEGTPEVSQSHDVRTPPPPVPSTSSKPETSSSECIPITSTSSITPVASRSRRPDSDEGSPEIDDDFSMSPVEKRIPVEDIPPIPLPVPVHMIKQEKEDTIPKLKLRVSVAVLQKGIEMAASEDDDDIQEIKRKPIKVKLSLRDIKREEPSPDREVSRNVNPARPAPTTKSTIPVESAPQDTSTPTQKPLFKTPLPTPLKTTESRKRKRSDKIEGTPKEKKSDQAPSNFVTPKNGLIPEQDVGTERFLKTMTVGRRIIMKIGKIPNNINHFVTPRRDGKGNMHKDIRATEHTRLKMRLYKKNGQLAVEVTERNPEELKKKDDEPSTSGGPSGSGSIVPTPTIPTTAVKARPAPASRKGSIDIAGKDKKSSTIKSKNTFSNRFNPFATASKPKPLTISVPTPAPSVSGVMKFNTPAGSSSSVVPSSAKPSAASVAPTTNVQTTVRQQQPVSSIQNLIKTTPIVPKITVTNSNTCGDLPKPKPPVETTMNSLLPWMFDRVETDEKPKIVKTPQPTSSSVPSSASTKDLLHVRTELVEGVAVTAQESPRASSSLSMSFFEDDKSNGYHFLNSPKRTSEPLPAISFSDDDDDDVHNTFQHATDHMKSKLKKPVNGAAPILPWSTDP
ncbi:hypothetical protein L5515_011420 [Caenorhabditis briggsae]|uniref:GLTSCR protein conserved domain-containing protein n=1 Tax=Caenorhabditis briggsae TaxID=6238 RepID=A0AAE9EVH5_CAEBR|nr:hypothetical protein L5515_011420 [Caenorhabditis briggsae]